MISIIVATYNSQEKISRCLESIKKQTYSDWECIIVDGESSDNTLSIVNDFVDKDKRFRVLSEKDKGVYDAFNKGWNLAKGEWIYYLGSDDELLPDGLDCLIKNSEGVDLVYGGIVRRYRSGKTKSSLPGVFEKQMPFTIAASHQSIIMKRDFIKRCNGFNLKYKILADFDLLSHAYSLGIKTRRVENLIAVFQLGGLSADSIHASNERYQILTSYGVNKYRACLHCAYMFIRLSMLKIKHYFD